MSRCNQERLRGSRLSVTVGYSRALARGNVLLCQVAWLRIHIRRPYGREARVRSAPAPVHLGGGLGARSAVLL